jgi:hypothetical protein
VDPSVIDTVAKFFFFTALDERISFTASLKVLTELKSKNWIGTQHRARWVQVLAKWRAKIYLVSPKVFSEDPSDRGFLFPDNLDFSHWIAFQSTAPPTEVEAVLLSKILGFQDEEIASGLGVSVGTVRYRVGRGLRGLGGYVEP